MRIVTFGGAVSLDGFLSGANGSIDWLHYSKDVQQIMADYWKQIDTVLWGRKTYDVAVAQNNAKGKTSKKPKRSANKKPAIRNYVFSRTLKAIDDPNYELISSDAVEFVRKLKSQPGKEICLMGGGELAQSLLAADLVDQVGLNIHPILLGEGIPTFRDPGHRVKLKLTECRSIDGGCVFAKYEILNAK
jgi:dihydrofolate reductase